jgi:hypothetical protein
MQVKHFNPQASNLLSHPSALLISLRHGKILINNSLRWCSVGLVASYMLTITAGIYFNNGLALTSAWTSYLLPTSLILLFVCLIYIQYCYSEKRTDNSRLYEKDIRSNSDNIGGHYKTNRKFVRYYLIANLSIWASMAFFSLPEVHGAPIFYLVSGLTLYGLGLFKLAALLKEKCTIGRKIGHLTTF